MAPLQMPPEGSAEAAVPLEKPGCLREALAGGLRQDKGETVDSGVQ